MKAELVLNPTTNHRAGECAMVGCPPPADRPPRKSKPDVIRPLRPAAPAAPAEQGGGAYKPRDMNTRLWFVEGGGV